MFKQKLENLNNLKKQDSSDVFIEKNLEEDNKKKEIRQQIFIELKNNYVDENENLRRDNALYCGIDVGEYYKPIISDKIAILWNKLLDDYNIDEWDEDNNNIQNFFGNIVLDKDLVCLLKKNFIDKKADLKDRIICTNVIRDIANSLVENDQEHVATEYVNMLEDLEKSKDVPYILKIYLERVVSEAKQLIESTYFDSYDDIELSKNTDERMKIINDFHDNKYDCINMVFDDKMKMILSEAVYREGYGDIFRPIGKMIDIDGKEDWDGDYIVSQAAPGRIGIYSLNGNMVGWKKEDEIKEEVEIDGQKTFYDFAINQNDVFFMNLLTSLPFRSALKDRIGFDIAGLSPEYQKSFLIYIKNKTEDEIDELIRFIKKSNNESCAVNRVKSFLSLESGELSGEEILLISESLKDDQDIANGIFAAYAKLSDQADISREQINEFFKVEKEFKTEDVDKVSRSILNKANSLLVNYVKQIKKGEEISTKELLDIIENYKEDAVVFSSIFKTAHEKEDVISFEELRGVDYKTSFSVELSSEEKKMILDVVRLNYPDKEQQEDILQKIEESFKNDKTKWHLLTRQGEQEKSLVSCLRFDELDEKNVYAATFNVGTAYRGSKLGDAMFDRVMTEVAQNKKIHAIAEMDKSVSDYYINKGGFNAKGIKTNEKTQRKYYEIERFDPENEFYGTKRITSNNDLLTYYKEGAKPDDLVRMQKYILVKKEDLNKAFNQREIEYILNNGYLLTRTIKNKPVNGRNDSYLVFEKKAMKARDDQKQAA